MNKYLLFFFFSVLCTDAIAQNNFIVAGQKGTAAYVDLVPDHFVNCSPTPPSETCGPVYDSLDLNKDSVVDYVLMSYHTGYSGLSYEFHRIFPMGNNEEIRNIKMRFYMQMSLLFGISRIKLQHQEDLS